MIGDILCWLVGIGDSIMLRISRQMPCREIRVAGERYMERHYVCQFRGWKVYLHRYLSADGDREMHDHPWMHSIGIPLVGGYLEERMVGLDARQGAITRKRNIWWMRPNHICGSCFHRIASVRRNTWTLFIRSQSFKGWGFLRDERQNGEPVVVYHSAYTSITKAHKSWERASPPAWAIRLGNGERV